MTLYTTQGTESTSTETADELVPNPVPTIVTVTPPGLFPYGGLIEVILGVALFL